MSKFDINVNGWAAAGMRCAPFIVLVLAALVVRAAEPPVERPRIDPLLRAVDLNVGQSADVKLSDGKTARVKLLALKEHRCEMRSAVRRAMVTVEVNGKRAELVCAMYNLPKTVGGVQIDCAVTRGYVTSPNPANVWALEKDVRLRLWPAGSLWVCPGTFA